MRLTTHKECMICICPLFIVTIYCYLSFHGINTMIKYKLCHLNRSFFRFNISSNQSMWINNTKWSPITTRKRLISATEITSSGISYFKSIFTWRFIRKDGFSRRELSQIWSHTGENTIITIGRPFLIGSQIFPFVFIWITKRNMISWIIGFHSSS